MTLNQQVSPIVGRVTPKPESLYRVHLDTAQETPEADELAQAGGSLYTRVAAHKCQEVQLLQDPDTLGHLFYMHKGGGGNNPSRGLYILCRKYRKKGQCRQDADYYLRQCNSDRPGFELVLETASRTVPVLHAYLAMGLPRQHPLQQTLLCRCASRGASQTFLEACRDILHLRLHRDMLRIDEQAAEDWAPWLHAHTVDTPTPEAARSPSFTEGSLAQDAAMRLNRVLQHLHNDGA